MNEYLVFNRDAEGHQVIINLGAVAHFDRMVLTDGQVKVYFYMMGQSGVSVVLKDAENIAIFDAWIESAAANPHIQDVDTFQATLGIKK